jgi:hypothetical protein
MKKIASLILISSISLAKKNSKISFLSNLYTPGISINFNEGVIEKNEEIEKERFSDVKIKPIKGGSIGFFYRRPSNYIGIEFSIDQFKVDSLLIKKDASTDSEPGKREIESVISINNSLINTYSLHAAFISTKKISTFADAFFKATLGFSAAENNLTTTVTHEDNEYEYNNNDTNYSFSGSLNLGLKLHINSSSSIHIGCSFKKIFQQELYKLRFVSSKGLVKVSTIPVSVESLRLYVGMQVELP